MKNYFYILLFISLIYYSCNAPIQTSSNGAYPMEIGNSWTYTKTIEYISSSGDSIPGFIASQFDTHTVTVLVDRIEILNDSQSTYVVKTRDGFSTDFSENILYQ